MMDSRSQKKNSETERTIVLGKSLLKKEEIRFSLNATQKVHDDSEINSITQDVEAPRKEKDFKNKISSYHGQDLVKVWEHQRQLQSPKTFLSFGDEKNRSQPSLKGLKAVKITSTPENTEPPNLRNHVTSWHSWSSTATQMQNLKIKQKRNQTTQIKSFLNLTEWYDSTTPGSLGFMHSQTKHPHFVKHEKNVATSSSVGPPLHLRATTSNVSQTTKPIRYEYLSTLLENRIPENSSANSILPNLLAVVLETISKTTPSSTQPYNTTQIMTNTTNISGDTYMKPNTTTTAQMLTNITSSFINYNHTLPVQVQTTPTPIVEVMTTNVKDVKTTVQDNLITGHNVTSTGLEYKATLIEGRSLSTPSNEKVYITQKVSSTSTPGTTWTVTTITSDSRRNHKNFGILKKAFKRRVQCIYPPLPNHGTFRFLTIRDPLPNQYPYYIQYSCYPGYIMSTGDVYSFCKEDGEWSGLTPVCEDK